VTKPDAEQLADAIATRGSSARNVQVQISFDVVRLLSEQLYASPVKAVEELVVNGWDAGADVCSVLVDVDGDAIIAVYDDGIGMTVDQLSDLWHIGVSHKAQLARTRKQIGKFGIGKLASYAVARRATYISKAAGQSQVQAVSINFDELATRTDDAGKTTPLTLDIRTIAIDELKSLPSFHRAKRVLEVDQVNEVDLKSVASWTMVVLEDLRDRAFALATPRRLRWVLSTAMPRATDFELYLNSSPVRSSRAQIKRRVELQVEDIEERRLRDLNAKGEDWTIRDGLLVSSKFPSGITGTAFVTEQSLYKDGGKSEDLGRSHGFFVRVLGRLINETDPLFGARPLSFSTWYHFAADVNADDLNAYVTAARDDLEQSELKPALRALLVELFNQCRDASERLDFAERAKQKDRVETEREYVTRRIFEQPLADALALEAHGVENSIETQWVLVDPVDRELIPAIVEGLYENTSTRRKYRYLYAASGDNEPFVRLDAQSSTLRLNEDHPLVIEHAESPGGRRLLEVVAAAETMLEAYMREADVPNETVRELLARRDLLLRSLAQDESQSLTAIAASLRRNATLSADSKALEISVVSALRALGFAAQHVSNAGTPDGIAKYDVYGVDQHRLTLEAKSSQGTPSLNALDFAGLRSHADASHATGALVVAPTYPGIDDESSETTTRSRMLRVSSWTADQLATVVESAESRHISASQVQNIIENQYAPIDVKAAIDALLVPTDYSRRDLYGAVMWSLDQLQNRLHDTPRTAEMLAAAIALSPEFESVSGSDVDEAVRDLARASRGLLHITDENKILLLGDLDEIRRRVEVMTGEDTAPRRLGTFRDRTPSPEHDPQTPRQTDTRKVDVDRA